MRIYLNGGIFIGGYSKSKIKEKKRFKWQNGALSFFKN